MIACATPVPAKPYQQITPTMNLSVQGSNTSDQVFAIYIFDPGSLGTLGYSVESSWPLLQKVDLNTKTLVITEQDIVSYDWTHQILELNESFRLRYEESASSFLADFSPFVVTLADEPVFGGMIIQPFSPLAIDYPVLYVLNDPQYQSSRTLSIALRPVHDYRAKFDAMSPFPGTNPVVNERVRQRLLALDKLVD